MARYYAAIGRHDSAEAKRLLAPEVREFYEHSEDSDFTNVVTLTNVRDVRDVGAPAGGGFPAGYRDATEVAVTYDVVYKQVVTEESGTATRFLVVGRIAESAPWEILEIGTGP